MAIQPKTPGLHPIALRCLDFARTKAFYQDLLGFPMVLETPFNTGLDHLAMAREDATELHRVTAALQAAGVENTGVKTDPTLQKDYVAFKDPDRISWEFYMI